MVETAAANDEAALVIAACRQRAFGHEQNRQRGARRRPNLQLHQPFGGKADHLAQKAARSLQR